MNADDIIDASNLEDGADKAVFVTEIAGWLNESRPGIGREFLRNYFLCLVQDGCSGNLHRDIDLRSRQFRKGTGDRSFTGNLSGTGTAGQDNQYQWQQLFFQ
jgi:hypothetical protein